MRRRQHAAPGIEQHHGLRPGGNLRVQIQDGGLGQHVEQPMKIARRLVHHAFDLAEGLAAPSFHHIGCHRTRTPREADQRHSAAQFAAHQRHGIDHVLELPARVRHAEFGNVRRAAHRMFEFRALTGLELQPQIHRMRDRQNIREQNGGIQGIPLDGLQRYLAGNIGIGAHGEEIPGPCPGCAVLRQITPRLTHQPDRPARRRFPQQGSQQQVVLEYFAHLLALMFSCSRSFTGIE